MEVAEFDQCRLVARSRNLRMLALSSPEGASAEQPRRRRELGLPHLHEFCRRPAREDRIGASVSGLELAAAQEEVAPGEWLLVLASGRSLDPVERRSKVSCWEGQREERIDVLGARAFLAAVRRATRDAAA